MTAALGLSAAAPVLAQSAALIAQHQKADGPSKATKPKAEHRQGWRAQRGARQRGGALAGLLNFGHGAQSIEIATIRLTHALELTSSQTPLLAALKTSALTAQTDFAAVVSANKPSETGQKPSMAAWIKARAAIETAHAASLTSVLPQLEAFTASLSAEQQAKLASNRGERRNDERHNNQRRLGQHQQGQHRDMHPNANQPNADQPPPADAPNPLIKG